MRRVRIDELGEEGEKEDRRLRVEDVHEDSLCERATEVPLAAERDLGLGAATLVDRAGDDVDDRGGGHDQQCKRSEDENPDCWRVRDQTFSSQTRRSPSSVKNGSTHSIVRECGATRSASPPVATARASAPSSSRIRPTMPSTWPANP